MDNRYELAQLERDANKEGAWQAKIAYAKFILETSNQPSEEKRKRAFEYIKTIIEENIAEYVIEAKYLDESYNEKPYFNAIKMHELKKLRNEQVPQIMMRTNDSPEIQYKKARFWYETLIKNSKSSSNKIREEMIARLKQILFNKEMTDTLQAKIYFQLMRLHIEQAKEKKQQIYLEEAKEYGLLLTKNPSLKNMHKAKEAKGIINIINNVTEKSALEFQEHLRNAFSIGKKSSRHLFKYIGIALGNVIDISLFLLPKLVGKNSLNFPQKNYNFAQKYLKNSGFALVFKFFGKQFGEHVVGNFISPLSLLAGLASYPFTLTYHRYKNDENISKLSEKIFKLEKADNIKNFQTNLPDSTQVIKHIFDSKQDAPIYGGIDQPLPSHAIHNKVAVYPSNLSQNPKKRYAYGRIFSEIELKEEPTTQMKKEHQHIKSM